METVDTVEVVKSVLVALGTGWVLWLLFGLSLASVAIAGERWLFFRSRDCRLAAVVERVERALACGSGDDAVESLRTERALAGRVAVAGIELADRGMDAAQNGMHAAMAIERVGLERRLGVLGTLGNNAPFIGLLGTVIGVILAFEELGRATAGGPTDQIASSTVMSAIAEALVATAVGIAVALPAVAFYNYFQRRIAAMLADAEAICGLVLAGVGADAAQRTTSVRRRTQPEVDVGGAVPETRIGVRTRRAV
jgi:biopolymer transport protein ExbB